MWFRVEGESLSDRLLIIERSTISVQGNLHMLLLSERFGASVPEYRVEASYGIAGLLGTAPNRQVDISRVESRN